MNQYSNNILFNNVRVIVYIVYIYIYIYIIAQLFIYSLIYSIFNFICKHTAYK